MFVPVVDASQAAEWDRQTRETGVPSRVLMESAGRGAANVIGREFGRQMADGARAIVAAGHGNNGGDGWVVARALRTAGATVGVAETGKRRSPDCAASRSLALACGVELLSVDDAWPPAAVVVDALLGTGATGPPRDAIGRLADRVAGHGAPIVAIDGPTGLDLTTGAAHGPVRANLTVTFGGFRRGHLLAREWCGAIEVLDIGFAEPDVTWPEFVRDRWVAESLPGFDPRMHKGDRGQVLVVGGESGMAGAVHHAARAALAAGAGLVRVAAHPQTVAALQVMLPDVTAIETALRSPVEPELAAAMQWADAIVLGPGLGRDEERSEFVGTILETTDTPFVIDADGLRVGREVLESGTAGRILTPHLGEFRAVFRDLGDWAKADPFSAAAAAVEHWATGTSGGSGSGSPRASDGSPEVVVLLKGVPTVIASCGTRLTVVGRGNPALATGGSGDLLSGFIGTFVARGLPHHAAAGLGAYVLGCSAEIAACHVTVRSVRPADVLSALPELWRSLGVPHPTRPPVLVHLDPPAVV